MKLIMQPKESTICGQCCIGMIADKPIEEIIDLLGFETPMNLTLFMGVFNTLGFEYKIAYFDGDAGYFDDYKGKGLMRIAMAEDKYGMGHAVAFHDGKIYDPMNEKPFDNIVDLCMQYLKKTGEVFIVDFKMTTTKRKDDQNGN